MKQFISIPVFFAVFFANSTAVVVQADAPTPQCANERDDDKDGGYDFLKYVKPGNNVKRTIANGNPFTLRGFQRQAAKQRGLIEIPEQDPGSGAVNFDRTTAKALCNLAGFRDVDWFACWSPIYGRCGYRSPHNNSLGRWNSKYKNFEILNAANLGNRWMSSLRCKDYIPACDDGIDNDKDGLIDSKDNGCDSKFDDSERVHDPDCDSAKDNSEKPDPACSDGIDNDGDGRKDYPRDPGCKNKNDTNEREPSGSACDNGKDDDGDGLSDFPQDPGCTGPADGSERQVNGAACDNNKDDDGDGLRDYPADPGCKSPTDGNERQVGGASCDNHVDDDGDGLNDYPADPGCSSPRDNNETNQCTPGSEDSRDCNSGKHGICGAGHKVRACGSNGKWKAFGACRPIITPGEQTEVCTDGIDNDCDGKIDLADSNCSGDRTQCNDGKDNDGDGLTDYPNDPGCKGPKDDNERQVDGAACDNNKDDDGDGLTDYPHDPGCKGPKDNNERQLDGAACDNNKDDDGDGLKDFPADPGCRSAKDNSESNACKPGEKQMKECSTGHPGICIDGWKNRVCNAKGSWGSFGNCAPEVAPGDRVEECFDSIDNDCDGYTDAEDTDCKDSCIPESWGQEECKTGLPGICADGKFLWLCRWDGKYIEEECKPLHQPGEKAENCYDYKDNDCDGLIDYADPDC